MTTRGEFDRRLQALENEVLELGQMVEAAIGKAVEALKRRDLEASRRIIEEDEAIDKRRFQIEEQCLELMATQQPMARDLRVLVAVLNIIVDLERMGDHAEGIGKISLMLGDQPLIKPLIDIPRMADKAREMLRRSLEAFIHRDIEEARRLCAADDEVDALYDQVYRELLLFMLKDPKTIDQATHLLWVAHNLERIADRVTNIAERVYFMVTGKLEEKLAVSSY